MADLRIHESLEELGAELAEYIAEIAESSVKERGAFALALSGGSLIAFMGKLCEAPYNKTVEWGKWYIFWADERVVGKSHSDSNYKLAKHHLLSKVPIPGSHVYPINDGVSGEEAASEYEFGVRQLVKSRVIGVSDVSDCPKFDLVLLGMGSDGHVASLFPGHAALREHDAWITFLADSPEPPPERMTFTLPVINSAAHVAVVAAGGAKADAARAAVCGGGSNCPSVPAAMVQPKRGKLVWFLDKAAASKLDSFRST